MRIINYRKNRCTQFGDLMSNSDYETDLILAQFSKLHMWKKCVLRQLLKNNLIIKNY